MGAIWRIAKNGIGDALTAWTCCHVNAAVQGCADKVRTQFFALFSTCASHLTMKSTKYFQIYCVM